MLCYDALRHMELTRSDYVLWIVSTVLQLAVCGLVLRGGLYLRLPAFSAYVWLNLLTLALVWWAYLRLGYSSMFYIGWAAFGVALLARGLVVGELCRRVLRLYRGVWALAWRLLVGAAMLLLVYAGLAAYGTRDRLETFFMTAERGMELAAAIVLLLLLVISSYYRIPVPMLEGMLALGLGVWSLLQVVNNVALLLWPNYYAWGSAVKMVSFQLVLLIWIAALRKPVLHEAPAPALLPQTVYDELAPQTNLRLRLLNERLLEIFKT